MRRSLDEEFLLHRISKLEAEVERLKNERPTKVEAQGLEDGSLDKGLLQRISKLEVEVAKFKNRDVHHSRLIRMLAESIEALEPPSNESRPDEHVVQPLDTWTPQIKGGGVEPTSPPITVEKLVGPKK